VDSRFHFGGARFDLNSDSDREFLGWVFQQFLYGEVTGIQCGHWLYHAPTLLAAQFIAKQAQEELAHVRKIHRILQILKITPAPAHPAIRFLATGMMGGTWGEHVCMEMALGESLVLQAFYAMSDTIDQPEIHRLIVSAIEDEERHVEFGERQTLEWLEKNPIDRWVYLGKLGIQQWGLRSLARGISGKWQGHSVLGQFDAYFHWVLRQQEDQGVKLGLSSRRWSEMSLIRQISIVLFSIGVSFIRSVWRVAFGRFQKRLLTDTYLSDSLLKG
jgi:hypothetical protein